MSIEKKTYDELLSQNKELKKELSICKKKAEESAKLKSIFLSNLSHEIRTPMNLIMGFSGLLKRENIPVEKKDNYLQLIELGCKKLLNRITDIVDVSKISSNQLKLNYKDIDINDLIDQLYLKFESQVTCNNNSLKTVKSLFNNDSLISIDETRLIQIFANLLSNSFKYTKNGEIEFGYYVDDEFIRCFVKDTGIGINKKYLNKVFNSFNQINNDFSKSGIGLGLSIVKSLVELMNGNVWIESDINKGTIVNFTIPFRQVKRINENISVNDAEYKTNRELSILIAEDEDSNFMLIEVLLEDKPYNIIRAKNGKEAVNILKENDEIDIILMDIKMPIMNGYEAIKSIRKINKEIPIIAITAYAMSDDKIRVMEAGCNDYLLKPIFKNKLFNKINKYIK